MSERVVIATGSRDLKDRRFVYDALDKEHARLPIRLLKHGDYRGLDRLARDWARERGVLEWPFPADWNTHGPKAGPLRNQQMADSGADDLLRFPGGDGTADMERRARAAKINVISIAPPQTQVPDTPHEGSGADT
jgi:hypothetical protein